MHTKAQRRKLLIKQRMYILVWNSIIRQQKLKMNKRMIRNYILDMLVNQVTELKYKNEQLRKLKTKTYTKHAVQGTPEEG